VNISLGRDSITGNDFSMETTKHVNISGMSGMGKSTLIANVFIEHIRQGNGGLLLIPRRHGRSDRQAHPKNRMRDFTWMLQLFQPLRLFHLQTAIFLALAVVGLFRKSGFVACCRSRLPVGDRHFDLPKHVHRGPDWNRTVESKSAPPEIRDRQIEQYRAGAHGLRVHTVKDFS
jgi:ABC-type ATPase involved in cell division